MNGLLLLVIPSVLLRLMRVKIALIIVFLFFFFNEQNLLGSLKKFVSSSYLFDRYFHTRFQRRACVPKICISAT